MEFPIYNGVLSTVCVLHMYHIDIVTGGVGTFSTWEGVVENLFTAVGYPPGDPSVNPLKPVS
jgi:hypothetical protein